MNAEFDNTTPIQRLETLTSLANSIVDLTNKSMDKKEEKPTGIAGLDAVVSGMFGGKLNHDAIREIEAKMLHDKTTYELTVENLEGTKKYMSGDTSYRKEHSAELQTISSSLNTVIENKFKLDAINAQHPDWSANEPAPKAPEEKLHFKDAKAEKLGEEALNDLLGEGNVVSKSKIEKALAGLGVKADLKTSEDLMKAANTLSSAISDFHEHHGEVQAQAGGGKAQVAAKVR